MSWSGRVAGMMWGRVKNNMEASSAVEFAGLIFRLYNISRHDVVSWFTLGLGIQGYY